LELSQLDCETTLARLFDRHENPPQAFQYGRKIQQFVAFPALFDAKIKNMKIDPNKLMKANYLTKRQNARCQ
jgi:hypothetical protein